MSTTGEGSEGANIFRFLQQPRAVGIELSTVVSPSGNVQQGVGGRGEEILVGVMMRDNVGDPNIAAIGHSILCRFLFDGPSRRRNHFPNSTNGVSCKSEGLQDCGIDEGTAACLRIFFLSDSLTASASWYAREREEGTPPTESSGEVSRRKRRV